MLTPAYARLEATKLVDLGLKVVCGLASYLGVLRLNSSSYSFPMSLNLSQTLIQSLILFAPTSFPLVFLFDSNQMLQALDVGASLHQHYKVSHTGIEIELYTDLALG